MLVTSVRAEGTARHVGLAGRLDILTSPRFLDEMRSLPADVTDLTISLRDVSYVSVDGLRALLVVTDMIVRHGGTCTLTDVGETIMGTFQVMGLQNTFSIS